MNTNDLTLLIKKYTLHNAIQFKGTANENAVMGKIIPQSKEYNLTPQQLIPKIKKIVQEINSLSLDQQIQELKIIAPELLHREKKTRTFELPPLPHAKQHRVVTRFPPEPNGYLHIGHAKAAIIDYEYAQKYDGKFILRFDDTNPESAELAFYKAQKEDLKWLGITWDEEYNTSDHLETHYTLASKLIAKNNAYVCTCSPENIKKLRYKKKTCACRKNLPSANLTLWKNMLDNKLPGAVLRLMADMNSANTAMRDPTLFRIIHANHPNHGTKYHIWPTYDFAGAIEDSISGVTHPFRTKEYELRDECYFFLLDRLNLRKPYLQEFARLSLTGMPVSKRKIKPLIETGKVTGYDDIRLPTLRGLQKRGILPEAIHQFVLSQGTSKAESHVDFSQIEAFNRKLLDPTTPRYFFVTNPKKLVVKNAPKLKKTVPLHPSNKELGNRTIQTKEVFFITEDDFRALKKDEIFRLKELYNIQLHSKNDSAIGRFHSQELISDTKKIQWTTDKYIPMKIFIPHPLFINNRYNKNSLQTVTGFAETAISTLESGTIVQFERFGFVKIVHKNKTQLGFFTHK